MKISINNPLCSEWHADPEAREYNGKYYIYVTRSAPFDEQLNQDVFVSEDLCKWEKKESIIDMSGFPWVKRAVWAPTIIEKNGKYYYIFASNDIHQDNEGGGLEIAVSDSPEGPFKGYLDCSLIGEIINGAQPIDAHLFKDDDGTVYLYYGGWDHCNVCIMNDDMTGFVPFSDGEIYKEITPDGYKEGPCMMKRNGKYYFMWSSGGWTNGTYCVNYAISDNPLGPFERESTILSAQEPIAEGPGHNGFLQLSDGSCLMVYHRRRFDNKNAHARFLCIDKMEFDGEKIKPVIMTGTRSDYMNSPIFNIKTIAELAPGENNPRNSEGDFAVLNDGSILFAYSRYTGCSSEDEAPCDIAGMISHDGGKTFEHLPRLLVTAKEHNTSNIMSVSFCRLNNGTLCLFYLAKFGASSAYYMRRALENETEFGEAELCIEQSESIYYVINNCRVRKLPDGRLLVPAARHRIRERSNNERAGEYFATSQIFGSDANAENWHAVSDVIEMPNPGHSGTGLQEPGLSLLPDGRLYGYFRTDRAFQFESFSADEGKTWSAPIPSVFTAPESPMLIVRNPYNGIYYSVWNPVPLYNGRIKEETWCHAGRFPFVIAQSSNGIDFSECTAVESIPDHGYCYPAILFLNEKEMLMSYCCGGKEDGKCLSRTRISRITFE